jgi:Holliday junction resolvasome RuvABC endonuclease subunit
MPFNYTVVGIDQSLTATGLALIHSDKNIMAPEAPRHYTAALKPTKERGIERLMYIEKAVERWIPSGTDLAVMEGYAMGIRNGQVFSLGECGAIIKRTVSLRGIPLISVAPGTLKKYVSGNGAAKKNLMLLAAYKKFGVTFDDDNECDAYCMARLGQDYLDASAGNMPVGFTDTYKAVVKYNIKLAGGDVDE